MKKLLCAVLLLAMLASMAAAVLADVEIPATVGPGPGNYGVGGFPELAASVRSLPSQAIPPSQRGGQNGSVQFTSGRSTEPQLRLKLKEEYAVLEGASILNAPYDFIVSAENRAAAVAKMVQCTVERIGTNMIVWLFFTPDGMVYDDIYLFAQNYIGDASVYSCSHNSWECKYYEIVTDR